MEIAVLRIVCNAVIADQNTTRPVFRYIAVTMPRLARRRHPRAIQRVAVRYVQLQNTRRAGSTWFETMRFLFLACSVVLIPVCLQQETSPIEFHQVAHSAEAPLAPVKYRTSPLNRKQRNAFALKLGNSLGLKQTALNLILGKIYQAVAIGTAKTSQSGRGRRPPPPPPPVSTTTEEVPEFDRAAVRLDIPADLVQIGYRLTSNISKLIGSVIQNTADRKQQLVEAAKPYIAAKLGLDIRPSSFTTQAPIEDLVPRLGPPLGGPAQNSSDTSSTPPPGGTTANTSTPPPEDISANRIDRPGLGAF